MKDPMDKEERPYEVLGVSPDISVKEAEKVFAEFLRDRKNVSRRQAARVAHDRLRRIERRVEDEMFYYPSAASSLDGLQNEGIPPFAHEPAPPVLDIDVALAAGQWTVCEDDFDPFSARQVKIGRISSFEERLLLCLPVHYPK